LALTQEERPLFFPPVKVVAAPSEGAALDPGLQSQLAEPTPRTATQTEATSEQLLSTSSSSNIIDRAVAAGILLPVLSGVEEQYAASMRTLTGLQTGGSLHGTGMALIGICTATLHRLCHYNDTIEAVSETASTNPALSKRVYLSRAFITVLTMCVMYHHPVQFLGLATPRLVRRLRREVEEYYATLQDDVTGESRDVFLLRKEIEMIVFMAAVVAGNEDSADGRWFLDRALAIARIRQKFAMPRTGDTESSDCHFNSSDGSYAVCPGLGRAFQTVIKNPAGLLKR
jgi:hypothetical protein